MFRENRNRAEAALTNKRGAVVNMPAPDYSNIDMDAFNLRIVHYDTVYKLTTRIINSISRCELTEQYWFSTKHDSATAVLHTEDYYLEGPLGYVADLVSQVNTAKEFAELVEESMTRGSYPWLTLEKGDGDDGAQSK